MPFGIYETFLVLPKAKTKLSSIFNDFGEPNIKNFYFIEIFMNGWFPLGNWLFYWLKFMTLKDVGVFDAITFGLTVLLEIPTGAIADLLGKKGTLISAFLLNTLGISLMAFGDDKYTLLTGSIIFNSFGMALYSGAGEALVYDTLVEKKLEGVYDKIAANIGVIRTVATFASISIGGLLYYYNDRLPWIIWTFFMLGAVYYSTKLSEPQVDTIKFSIKNYFAQLVTGFKCLFGVKLREFLLIFLFCWGTYYMYDYGFIRQYIGAYLGFNGTSLSITLGIVGLLALIFVSYIPKFRKIIPDRIALYTITIIMSVSFAFIPIGSGLLKGIILLTIIDISGRLIEPWISIVINKEIPSEYRATTLSTFSFFTKIPYVFASIYLSELFDNGGLWLYTSATALILFLVFIVSFIYSYKNYKAKLA